MPTHYYAPPPVACAEEADIIILSLVRSSPPRGGLARPSIGFLGTENRVCVALSRAKHGCVRLQCFSLDRCWLSASLRRVACTARLRGVHPLPPPSCWHPLAAACVPVVTSMFVLGNFALLADRSPLWKRIVEDATYMGVIADSMTLVCSKHPHAAVAVRNPGDFDRSTPVRAGSTPLTPVAALPGWGRGRGGRVCVTPE
jgi:hypothetical protein